MASTIRDVAARAGLSVGTVSKYINGKTVKESTRLAIEEAIKELDFHPNNIAKGLRNAKSFSVAILLPMLTLIATSLCNTLANIDIPCSVNTYGNVRLPPRPSFFSDSCIFEVPDWHFKDSASSVVS